MHQQEVRRISLLPFTLGNPGSHRNCGNTGRTDQRIDLSAAQLVHQLADQQSADGAEGESDQAQYNNLDGIQRQEAGADHGRADADAQEQGNDVHQGVLSHIAQALRDTGFLQQVAEHQAADQGSSGGQQQHDENRHDDREQDLFGLAHLAQLRHLHAAFLFGGQRPHNGRLNHRDQRHVAVSRHGNRPQQFGSQLRRGQDGRGAVRAADNTDGSGLLRVEAQQVRAEEGEEHAELCSSAQQQALRVGNQRTEIGHRADAHEDQAGIDTGLHADVKDIDQAAFGKDIAVVMEVLLISCRERPCVQEAVPQILMIQGVRQLSVRRHKDRRYVRQQATHGDTDHQQRFILLLDTQIQQHARDGDHHQVPPSVRVAEESGKSGFRNQFSEGF